jgi:catechol 2,3-dioxygenase-like lactoylglutathione lyase family enzyme
LKITVSVLLIAFAAIAYSDVADNESADSPVRVTFRFVYNHCNDLEAMRHFYTDLLGMTEIGFNLDWNWLGYQCDGFQLCFFGAYETQPVLTEFTDQPGYHGGDLEGISWSIEIPGENFAETVDRLLEAEVPRLFDEPQLNLGSYWGFPVLDPMGITVEVFCFAEDIPESGNWSDR